MPSSKEDDQEELEQPLADSASVAEHPKSLISDDPAILAMSKSCLVDQPRMMIPDNSTILDLQMILSRLIERLFSTEPAIHSMSTTKNVLPEQTKELIPDNSEVPELLKEMKQRQKQFLLHPALFDLSTVTSSLIEQLQRLILLLQAHLASSSLDNSSHGHVSAF